MKESQLEKEQIQSTSPEPYRHHQQRHQKRFPGQTDDGYAQFQRADQLEAQTRDWRFSPLVISAAIIYVYHFETPIM